MSTETVTPAPTGDGPKVVAGGDSPLLFDDMDFSLARPAKEAKTRKVEEPQEEEKPKKKELTADDEGKAKPKESGKEEKKEKLAEPKDKEEAPKRKTHKAKWDKNEWELDDEAELTVKVDGKEQPVKLNELLSNYSGKTNWSKRFQDLSVKDKELKTITQKLESKENLLRSIYSEKDPQKRIFLMSEVAGMNPMEFRARFLEDNLKMLEKYSTMSEDERKADATAFENAYLKHQMDTRTKAEERNQALKQLQEKVSGLLTSAKITEDEFEKQDQFLEEHFKKQGLDLKQITPEFVVETIQKDKLWMAAQAEFEKLSHHMPQAEMVGFIDKAFASGLEPADLPQVIDELFGKAKAKQIVEDKQKQAQEFKEGIKPKATNPKQDSKDIWSFDQF